MKNREMLRHLPSSNESYDEHTLRVLEFDAVRELVASFADSAEGRRLTGSVIPVKDPAEARALLAETDECMRAVRFDDPLPSIPVPELSELFPKLGVEGTVLDIEEIAAVAGCLEITSNCQGYFSARAEKYPLLTAITGDLTPHDDLAHSIRRAITPEFEIADNASPELRSIRRRLSRSRTALRDLIEKKLAQLADSIISERTVTIRDGRFVIPVRDNMKRQVPGAVHDRSQTGRTLFIEPLEAIEGNNDIRELELAERAEIARILADLSARIALIAGDLERNYGILVRLDMIAARARWGAAVDGAVSSIGDSPEIVIRRGRHPLLDWKLRQAGKTDRVVPLDLTIGGPTHTMVITGPNAGGKTVALKTAGLFVLMALTGIPVPAAEDTLLYAPPELFADIGDEQSIADDLSTFSSHMTHIITILREAAPGSLVVLDELGGGTNPSDGEAIALAVLRKLASRGVLTLASSHHDRLKLYAHDTPGAMNASMEFDTTNHRPTFVLSPGIPGSSYAFDIAARLGMPPDVIGDAQSLAGDERKSLAGLITELEERVLAARKDSEAAAVEREQAQTLRAGLEEKLAKLDSQRDGIVAAAIEESKRILADTNRRVEEAVRSLREQKASHEAIVETKAALRKAADGIEKRKARLAPRKKKTVRSPLETLTPGQNVWITTMETEGVVEEVLAGGTKARVRAGKGKATLIVDRENLAAAETSRREKQTVVISTPAVSLDSLELDLRGMTFDEARDELDRFLAELTASGAETARIIHGKGTGALRKKISAYLDRHQAVAGHRLGNWNEGSFGVTVVTLKG